MTPKYVYDGWFYAPGSTDPTRFRQEVDEAFYQTGHRAKEDCLKAVSLEEKIHLLLDNYAELEIELLRFAQMQLIRPTFDYEDAMDGRLLIDRRIANLLTAARMYLDQWPSVIRHFFPKLNEKKAQRERIDAFRKDLHLNTLGYRVMEGFRNYVQHHGLPSAAITISMTRFKTLEEGSFSQHSASVNLNPHVLLEVKEGNAKLRAEIKSFSDSLDIRPMVRQYVQCLVKIHLEIRNIIGPLVASSEAAFQASYEAVLARDVGGKPFGPPRLVKLDPQGSRVEELHYRMDILSRLSDLRARCKVAPELEKSFISSLAAKVP